MVYRARVSRQERQKLYHTARRWRNGGNAMTEKIQNNLKKPYYETLDSMVKLYHADCFDVLPKLQPIDCVMTDPPYMYIKNDACKFDRCNLDLPKLASMLSALVGENGFVASFGRGMMLARLMIALDGVGLRFKESICWDKCYPTSPCHKLMRKHEDCVLFSRKGLVRTSMVPYVEKKEFDFRRVENDIKRLVQALNNENDFKALQNFVASKKKDYYHSDAGRSLTVQSRLKDSNRAVNTAHSIFIGSKESDVIEVAHIHYHAIHPTEKPVRLIERILALISDRGDTILDPFAGSGSTGIACIQTGRRCILIEKDERYCEMIVNRLKSYTTYQQPR